MKHRVVIRDELHRDLADHLLAHYRTGTNQEDVCFALWYPGEGTDKYTGILGEVILPQRGERQLRGNVTIRAEYVNRVLNCALRKRAGVAVLHSHPADGWQSLSQDDIDTEQNCISPFIRESRLPLLGLTLSTDELWSARYWFDDIVGNPRLMICSDVRRVGTRSTSSISPPATHAPYARRDILKRTIDSWGISTQARLARTHICVVGVGSVGAMVVESLGRIGIEEITIIDPDEVARHNLDRLVYADHSQVGQMKVHVAASRFRRVSTAARPVVHTLPLSIRTERAYRLAADADLIVCCVDNAEARDVMNHLAYSNCIPLIDGGVAVDSSEIRLNSAKWRVHLVGPDMRCLRCRSQYTSSEASDERQGLRRQGRYIDQGNTQNPEPGQNTFAFCNFVAAEEIRVLLRYLVGESWWHDPSPDSGLWSFEHRFVDAQTSRFQHPGACAASCEFTNRRLGLGMLGRPTYPFLPEFGVPWCERLKRGVRRPFRALFHLSRQVSQRFPH